MKYIILVLIESILLTSKMYVKYLGRSRWTWVKRRYCKFILCIANIFPIIFYIYPIENIWSFLLTLFINLLLNSKKLVSDISFY